MLIDGEKYACDACVRGHRVSTCQHSDRTLTHINKKGRPVSQCPHCRGLRKARATHTACECGSKPHSKEECTENESKSDHSETHSDSTSDPGSSEQRTTCCCSHGMKCTCALKKDHLDPVPEAGLPAIPPKRSSSSRKPRLLKAGSENSMTVFTNGHHKRTHKHNDSAHKCGIPYTIPIPHSVHGNADVARRSADSLPLLKRKEEPYSQLSDSISSAQQEMRLVRSEHGSPEPRAARYRDRRGHLPPLDFSSYPMLSAENGTEEYFQSPREFETYYSPADDGPVLSAGLSMAPSSVDWNSMDLPLDQGAYSAAFSQPPSYASFDHNNVGQPALTTSSSGGASDAADYVSHDAQGKMFRSDFVATSSAEERNLNRLSSSSYTSMPQASRLSSSNLNSIDMDTYLHPTTASPTEFEEPAPGMSEAYERHGFTVHDVQKMAHPDGRTEILQGMTLPIPADDIDSVWPASFSKPPETALFSRAPLNNDWR